MKDHRYVRQVEGNELSEKETFPVFSRLSQMDLGPAQIDVGRLAVGYSVQGATEGQITTVSYGAERPAMVGNDEGAWAKNRRVEIVYLGPGGQAAPVQPQR